MVTKFLDHCVMVIVSVVILLKKHLTISITAPDNSVPILISVAIRERNVEFLLYLNVYPTLMFRLLILNKNNTK